MDPKEITAQANAFVTELSALAAVALPRFISAVILLAAGWWLANWIDRTLRRLIDGRIDPTLTSVAASLARYGILVVVGVAVLGQLGIQTTSVLAALGAVGLAVGLAMQGTLANVAAGMMLLWLRPFKVGDYIDTGTIAGTVKDVGLFASELHSWDGIYQFVPNGQLWNVRLINYSRLPTRLVELQFGVSHGDDLAKGQKTLLDLARADDRVLREPSPMVFVNAIEDSAVTLSLRCWAATSDYWPLRRELTEHGKTALEAAGLSIALPQRHIHVHQIPPTAPPPEAKAA